MTALLPDAQSLINLLSCIIANRVETPIPVAFPGYPALSDLDGLYSAPSQLVSTRLPAFDALTLSLTRRFNKLSENESASASVLPFIYGIYQAYLKRTPTHIKLALLDAKANGYSLGVKLVRGVYHPHEMLAHQSRQSEKQVGKGKQSQSLSISPDSFPPVWETKPETDSCYNVCVKTLIDAIQVDMEPVASTGPRSSWISPSSWLTKFTGPKRTAPKPFYHRRAFRHPQLDFVQILDELVDRGLAARELTLGNTESIVHLDEDVTEQIMIGQLYGISVVSALSIEKLKPIL
ncbi:hypothetical protein ONZ45_g13083 [Pleurotus djamor]|nr:hypothetical protein ONZ45_g13083 [Pleurotus djamor]